MLTFQKYFNQLYSKKSQFQRVLVLICTSYLVTPPHDLLLNAICGNNGTNFTMGIHYQTSKRYKENLCREYDTL